MQYEGYLLYLLIIFNQYIPANTKLTWVDGLVYGLRMGLTFMGYVVFLRVAGQILDEAVQCRRRRLFAIARLSVHEANRRMWAPWVVITVFLLVLAFTHWFLQPPRAAEMGRLYVGTLTLLCSVLLTVMVTILTPLSLPTDIQQQTIYTVVSKPVRRLEMVWGRMIGYMALVTVLIAALRRDQPGLPVADGRQHDGRRRSRWRRRRETEGRLAEAKLLSRAGRAALHPDDGAGADQGVAVVPRLAGHAARDGDRRGAGHSSREPRSHIEGATPSAAIWSFGRVPDPFTPPGRHASDPQSDHPGRPVPPRGDDRVGPRPDVSARGADQRRSARPRSSPT